MSSTNRRPAKSPSAAEALSFNVSGLLAEPVGTIRYIEVASPPLDLGPELTQCSGVSGKLRLTRTNRGLLVHARLATSIDQECSRCLREIDYPLQLDLDEEALPVLDFATGLPLDAALEPDAYHLSDHHELLLENEVREAILLAEPIAALCRPDCPGLCMICGLELATGPHDHPDEDIDPRLEALKEFRAPD